MVVTLMWLISGVPGYIPAMAMLRLRSTLGGEVLWVSDPHFNANHYPGLPNIGAHPGDVTAHLWPADGVCYHSLPAPLKMLHGPSSCRETALSPESLRCPLN